jgi:hypothetical protein
VAKNTRDKDIGKKNAKNKQCKIAQNCNITDSVEFAQEPCADDKKKKARDDKNDRC